MTPTPSHMWDLPPPQLLLPQCLGAAERVLRLDPFFIPKPPSLQMPRMVRYRSDCLWATFWYSTLVKRKKPTRISLLPWNFTYASGFLCATCKGSGGPARAGSLYPSCSGHGKWGTKIRPNHGRAAWPMASPAIIPTAGDDAPNGMPECLMRPRV